MYRTKRRQSESQRKSESEIQRKQERNYTKAIKAMDRESRVFPSKQENTRNENSIYKARMRKSISNIERKQT